MFRSTTDGVGVDACDERGPADLGPDLTISVVVFVSSALRSWKYSNVSRRLKINSNRKIGLCQLTCDTALAIHHQTLDQPILVLQLFLTICRKTKQLDIRPLV